MATVEEMRPVLPIYCNTHKRQLNPVRARLGQIDGKTRPISLLYTYCFMN